MVVKFEVSYVTFLEFENILKKYFRKSFRQTEITFDFERVLYISLPQLCYLFGWIEQLIEKNVKIILDFQNGSGSQIIKVFKGYGFLSNLAKYPESSFKIKYAKYSNNRSNKQLNITDTPIINFQTFKTKESYNRFLERLKIDNLKKKANNIEEDRVLIDRAGIRDIFLKELGDNIFDHSKGSPAFIAVSKKSIENLMSKTNPDVIRNFANRNITKQYIEVVVADLGVGIPKKINEAFQKDKDAQQFFGNKKEISKIEYSFWREASSKNVRKLEEIIRYLKDEKILENLVAPTGLFLVYQLALEYEGLLYCRSGKSIVTWDFSGGKETKILGKTWTKNKLFAGGLEYIDGNIISLILPVNKMLKTINEKDIDYKFDKINPLSVKYVNACETLKEYPDENDGVLSVLKKIKYESLQLRVYNCVIVDLSNVELQTRSLYWIIIFCMYWRFKKKYIVVVDIEEHQKKLLKDQLKKEKIDYSKTPLYPIQCYESIEKKSESIQFSYFPEPIEIRRINEECLQEKLNEERKNIIISYILESFKPDERVYLPGPSKGFLKGYYELADIMTNSILCYFVAAEIYGKLKRVKVTHIILTTNILDRIAKNIAAILNIDSEKIYAPKNEASLTKIALKCRKEKGIILVISDVKITNNTVSHFVDRIGCNAITASIIESNATKRKDSKLILETINMYIDHKLRFYSNKPKQWKYSSIKLVDPVTHKLLYEKRGAKENIWKDGISKTYLEDWVKNKGLVSTGHICYGFVCYLYFFHMNSVVKEIFMDLSNEIYESVNKVLRIRKNEKEEIDYSEEVSYIVYPIQNVAAEKICQEIRTYLGGDLIHLPRITNEKNGTSYTQNPYSKDLNKGGKIVFFDTAATTTKTIRNILQLAGDIEADLLLIYLLINRISEDWPTFIEGIDVFKGCDVQIESFMKIGLPVHKSSTCPICRLLQHIERLLHENLPEHCKIILEKYMKQFEKTDLIDMREKYNYEGNRSVLFKQVKFRDKIEKMTSMINLEDKKDLINIIDSAYTDMELQLAILNALSLEIEFFINNHRYSRIFDEEIKNRLQKLSNNFIFKCNDEEGICDAIRVSSILNFKSFTQELVRNRIGKITDKVIKTLIACLFIYKADYSLDKCVQVLERLNSFSCEFEISDLSKRALSESAFHFRYLASIAIFRDTPYVSAYKNIISIYEQKDRSHTEIQSALSSLERIVKKQDIKLKVENVYVGENGFRAKFMDIIIPSLKKLIEAWPEQLSQELKKIKEKICFYLIELDQTLMTCYNFLEKDKLSNNIWISEKDKLYLTLTNISDTIFPNKGKNLKDILESPTCTYQEVINECLYELQSDFCLNNIIVRTEGPSLNEVSLVPKAHLKDVLGTIIDNMSKYSENNSNGTITVKNTNGCTKLVFESYPKKSLKIEEKPEHGLTKAISILSKYNSKIRFKNPINMRKKVRIELKINN